MFVSCVCWGGECALLGSTEGRKRKRGIAPALGQREVEAESGALGLN